jgi:hypothetical protein
LKLAGVTVMIVPLVVWLALQMLETDAPPVAMMTVQLVTVVPVLVMVTLSQNPDPQSLVAASAAVTEPDVIFDAVCPVPSAFSETLSEHAPLMNASATAAANLPRMHRISILLRLGRYPPHK